MYEEDDYFEQFKGMIPYLKIDRQSLQYIKDNWTREEASEKLADVCMTYELPLRETTIEQAREDYQKLKGVRWNELLIENRWFCRKAENLRYTMEYEGKMMYFKRYNVGNRASDFFQQMNRWSIDGSQAPGPVTTWSNPKFMKTLMGPYFTLGLEEINRKTLRTCLSLRKYTAGQFKPSVAKAVYDYFKAETIIDFSMGWGDRLCGFYTSETGKKYIGLDPRQENHPIYQEQMDFYESNNGFFEHRREVEMHQVPAEDFDYTPYHNQVDLIFTSPPYFNVEKYSHEDNQSWVRYKNIDVWNKEFLHTALGKMIPTLKKGGIMAINISDVYSNNGKERRSLSIVNPMCDFLTSHEMKYKGCIGMEIASRPNSGGAGMARETGIHNWNDELLKLVEETKYMRFAEPIWIFCKK